MFTFPENSVTALTLTFELALITTVILLVIGTPLAWWLANTRSRFRGLIEACVALPLVLPPTVLGFYLLVALGPRGPIGQLTDQLALPSLAFSFSGLVIGSVIYSLPFVVQPLQNTFRSLDRSLSDAAATMRATPLDRFFSLVVPLSWSGFITASVLGFAHTLGEFGVVLMIGGNIPGKTQVVSIAIYEQVESMNYPAAHALSAILLVISFVILSALFTLNKSRRGGLY
ncbi:molybdate ABC transporter permease subunit [Persicirhabdus sediminis]|uniref:Molybdenum transport system permease n=1 Tax=Persicirhabdus sediminis TaxID=454144 RepID=A0A8J7MEI3_9BACT|nr:molybdate ABC transporter permease subunit [Persicirhabdus sediminis]MBK1792459.1 molybdate ABC transporter permease subunit [Persicirhabdus sediminis]